MVQANFTVGDVCDSVPVASQQGISPGFNKRRRYVPPVRDSLSRVKRVGTPGSKRHQRFLNKLFLVEQQWELEPQDFQVVEFTCSPFSVLFEEENRKLWENFLDVTEEQQEQMLTQISDGLRPSKENTDEFGNWVIVESEDLEDGFEEIESCTPTASESFKRVEKHIRKLIRKNRENSFLLAIDKEITEYLQTKNEVRTYQFETGYHRMICHGVCQYYSLNSKSHQMKSDRILVVSKPKKGTQIPSSTLSQYLSL